MTHNSRFPTDLPVYGFNSSSQIRPYALKLFVRVTCGVHTNYTYTRASVFEVVRGDENKVLHWSSIVLPSPFGEFSLAIAQKHARSCDNVNPFASLVYHYFGTRSLFFWSLLHRNAMPSHNQIILRDIRKLVYIVVVTVTCAVDYESEFTKFKTLSITMRQQEDTCKCVNDVRETGDADWRSRSTMLGNALTSAGRFNTAHWRC